MSRRVAVNLTFFALVGVLFAWWAVTNVLRIDVVDKPYKLTAEFEESPGLSPDFDVAYLGVPVGTIESVALEDGRVIVEMTVDNDVDLPAGSAVAVRRKSAVGEPYIDFTPEEGTNTDGPFIEPGSTIPVEQTSIPLAYSELFEALNELVTAIPEDDLGTLFRELATGLDGRAESIRDLITGGEDFAETFAERSQLLEDVTRDLSRLVGTFADHRESFSQGLENTDVLTGTLASANADLQRVLESGDSLATRTADLIAGSKDHLSCTIGGLSTVVARLGQDDVIAALRQVFATGAGARDVFVDVAAYEDDGPYIRAIPPLNGGDENPAPVYPEVRRLPAVQGVAGCPAFGAGGAAGGAGAGGAEGENDDPQGPTLAGDPGPASAETAGIQRTSDKEIDTGGFDPVPILIGLGLIALIGATRPWRFLPFGRGDGSD